MATQSHTQLVQPVDPFDYIDLGIRVQFELQPGQAVPLVERASRYAATVWARFGPATEAPVLPEGRVLMMYIGDGDAEVRIPVQLKEIVVSRSGTGEILLAGLEVLPEGRRVPRTRREQVRRVA